MTPVRGLRSGPFGSLAPAGLAMIGFAIGAAAPEWAALTTLLGVAAAVAVVQPAIAAYLLALAVPFAALRDIRVGGVSLTAADALVGLLLLAWCARRLARREFPLWPTPLAIPFALFFAALAFSVSDAAFPLLSLKEMAKWLEFLAVALFVANEMEGAHHVRRLILLLVLAGGLEAALGWYQFLAQAGPKGFILFERFLRAYGTFGQPNPYAGYLNSVLPVALGILTARWTGRAPGWGGWRGTTLLIAALLMTGAVLFSFSRGGWLALGAAAALLMAFAARRTLALLLAAAVLALFLGLLGALSLLPTQVTGRLSAVTANFQLFDARTALLTPDNWSVVERMAVWQAAWSMFEERPLTGVGAGNFARLYPDYALRNWKDPQAHAHNFYLNLLSETGLLGLTAFLVFCLALLAFACHTVLLARRRTGADDHYGVALGLAAALAAITIHNLFDHLFVHSMTIQLGLLAGLLAVVHRHVAAAPARAWAPVNRQPAPDRPGRSHATQRWEGQPS
ncbi:MAG: O-antigen ligase family protein [Chloroflexi bacterium]|nr:O-antigen ligase family protein [Chloroflexota bacterium]